MITPLNIYNGTLKSVPQNMEGQLLPINKSKKMYNINFLFILYYESCLFDESFFSFSVSCNKIKLIKNTIFTLLSTSNEIIKNHHLNFHKMKYDHLQNKNSLSFFLVTIDSYIQIYIFSYQI
jgi:hypothetical protein